MSSTWKYFNKLKGSGKIESMMSELIETRPDIFYTM